MLDPFIIVVMYRRQVILYEKGIDSNSRCDRFFIPGRLSEDHIDLTKEIIEGRQDQLNGPGFRVPFKILDDPDGFHLVLLGECVLQLKDIVFLADPYIPLDIVFGDAPAVRQIHQQFVDLVVDPVQVIANMVDQ